MSHTDNEQRRSRLKQYIGQLALVTAAAASAGGGWYVRSKSQDMEPVSKEMQISAVFPPAGDTTHPLQQADVNKEYARLYDEISKAKQDAEEKGKKLIVLVGTNHLVSLSYLHEIMISDIAARLGIKDVVAEAPQKQFDMSKQGADEIARIRQIIASGSPAEDNPDLLFVHAGHSVRSAADVDRLLRTGALRQIACQFDFHVAAGHTLHQGDPERNDADGNMRDRNSKIVEGAMVSAITAQGKHALAIYGADHLSAIIEGINRSPDYALLAYDVTNSKIAEEIMGPANEERYRRREALKEEGIISPIIIDGALPSCENAAKCAIEASIAHRESQHTISRQDADMLRGLISTIYLESSASLGR